MKGTSKKMDLSCSALSWIISRDKVSELQKHFCRWRHRRLGDVEAKIRL